MRGMAGRRKRGSWCGIRERRRVDVRAERRGSFAGRVRKFGCRRRGMRRREGPRRRGREMKMCW